MPPSLLSLSLFLSLFLSLSFSFPPPSSSSSSSPSSSSFSSSSSSPPNILFILADDLGYGDVSWTRPSSSSSSSSSFSPPISTPFLSQYSKEGIILSEHHTPSTCTPSRASLMTGRYPANLGLVFAMLPGSPAGIPLDIPTLPQLLREKKGYRAHMVGKWHAGSARWEQTPVGRGFETHVGSYLWSMAYESKGLWELPWKFFTLDWVRAHENGTFSHYLERRHTTEALTEEALQVIDNHASSSSSSSPSSPLFLYLAYTAPHVPLEPLPEDEKKCQHLKHPWRRAFCGLVEGLDRGVGRVVERAREKLGNNTVVVFTSDNGGATWFGGSNEPLRSGKTTPFQGGVRVPTFVMDLSEDKKYFGEGGREWKGLAHMSDWLPTLLSLGEPPQQQQQQQQQPEKAKQQDHLPSSLDGFNLGSSLRSQSSSPRSSILLEMYYASLGEFLFPEDVAAYRKGKYKLIEQKGMRDAHWYKEPVDEMLNSNENSWFSWFFEKTLRFLEGYTDPGRFEAVRDLSVHIGVHAWQRVFQKGVEEVMLFDLEADPEERHNLVEDFPEVVEELRGEMYKIRDARPPQQKFWMTIDRELEWDDTLLPGDCSAFPEFEQRGECLFSHPWIKGEEHLKKVEDNLVDGAAAWPFIKELLKKLAEVLLFPLSLILTVFFLRWRNQ